MLLEKRSPVEPVVDEKPFFRPVSSGLQRRKRNPRVGQICHFDDAVEYDFFFGNRSYGQSVGEDIAFWRIFVRLDPCVESENGSM